MASALVKFPVICKVEISTGILNKLLTNDRLALITNLSPIQSTTSSPSSSPFSSPFTAPDPAQAIFDSFLESLKTNDQGLSAKALLILDKQTVANGGATCQIATDKRWENEDDSGVDMTQVTLESVAPFRCATGSVMQALEEIESYEGPLATATTMFVRILRNEAALVGGIWTWEKVKALREREPRIGVGEFPVSDKWPGPQTGSEDKYLVFRTADIGLETINSFLRQTLTTGDWGDDVDVHLCMVTSLTSPFHSGPLGSTKGFPPLEAKPALPESLLGASPSECDAIVRGRIVEHLEDGMCYTHWIVMDELTEATGTVLICEAGELDGFLQIARATFETAVETMVSVELTALCMDANAAGAAAVDGVCR